MGWFNGKPGKITQEDVDIGWENIRNRERELKFKEECFQKAVDLCSRENDLKIAEARLQTQVEVAKMKAQMEYDAYHWYHKECDKMMFNYRELVDKLITLLPQLKGEIQILESHGGCCQEEALKK